MRSDNMGELSSADSADRLLQTVDYLRSIDISLPAPVTKQEDLLALADAVDPQAIANELDTLPESQKLLSYRQFDVFYGSHTQMPETVREIMRLRERTFRAFEEGSGRAFDGDEFDQTYSHLLVWDREALAMVGAYRLGQTDKLRAKQGPGGVYLGNMFDFDDSFYAGTKLLEIGRSFVVPEYQKNHSSLYLLWCGIGRYLVRHPQYRRLYGVVSMSRLYDTRAIAAMRDALLEPENAVQAKAPYTPDLGRPWREFLTNRRPMAMRVLSQIVRALEGNKRDVPVLIRHYSKLGAKFIESAVDENFNNTPGLLLCVEVPHIPAKYLKMYMADRADEYLSYQPDSGT